MLLDLSEVFVCPRCRPDQGLVVLVDEIRDRRVVRGHLGCPECDARFPVEDGVLRFGAADGAPEAAPGARPDAAGGRGDAGAGAGEAPEEGAVPPGADDPAPPALFRGASRREAALRLGALLGLPEAGGPFLLGSGLGAVAVPLADMSEDEEVLALEGADGGDGSPRGGADDGPGGGGAAATAAGDAGDGPAGRRVTRVVGVVGADLPVFPGRLGGVALLGGTAGALREAVRAVRAGGRVVVVEPDGGVLDPVEDLTVEVAARDARAFVGVRRG